MYRPLGWRNPNKILIINPVPKGSDPTAFTAYEEGADAMLEALGKLPEACMLTKALILKGLHSGKTYRAILIPDETEESVEKQ